MRKYIYPLLVAMAMPILFTSCLSDDDVEYDDHCYITSFALSALKRTVYTYSSTGEDSTYSTTISGSSFPMTIDQRALTIENMDSLPLHSDLSKVLTSASFQGVLVWRKANLSEGEDTLWTTYSSSDSLDCREPLHFACFSSDGLTMRTYTMKVNAHKQNGDSTVWDEVGEVGALDGFETRKAFCQNGNIMVLGDEGNGSIACVAHPMGTSGDWVTYSTSGTSGADVQTLQKQGDVLYLSNDGGQVLRSENGMDWTLADYPSQEGLKLVGASDTRLYALLDGSLVSSDGAAWQEEALDDESEYLPTQQVYSFSYQLLDGQNRLLMVGARDNSDDTSCMVWAKTWRGDGEANSTWMFYVPNGTDKRRCPVMDNLNVVAYDDGFLSFGGRSRDGYYEPLDSMLYSQDHGVTWKPYENDDMIVDPLMHEDAADAKYIVSAVDDEEYLWVIIDKKVWRGRINRLGFLRKDPS